MIKGRFACASKYALAGGGIQRRETLEAVVCRLDETAGGPARDFVSDSSG